MPFQSKALLLAAIFIGTVSCSQRFEVTNSNSNFETAPAPNPNPIPPWQFIAPPGQPLNNFLNYDSRKASAYGTSGGVWGQIAFSKFTARHANGYLRHIGTPANWG